MLSLFNVITPKIPSRPSPSHGPKMLVNTRKKKFEVPVHGSKALSHPSNLLLEKLTEESAVYHHHSELTHDVPEKERSTRRSDKKLLKKENARLNKENKDLLMKFNELEDVSVKRITRLKEKIQTLQEFNAELAKENASVRSISENMYKECQQLQNRQCARCNELQSSIDKCTAENTDLRTSNNELIEDVNMLKTVIFRHVYTPFPIRTLKRSPKLFKNEF